MGTIKRTIKGICTDCWGLGEVATPKGRQTCKGCNGKGEREIVIVEEINDE